MALHNDITLTPKQLDAWLISLQQTYLNDYVLLTQAQELALWLQIIEVTLGSNYSWCSVVFKATWEELHQSQIPFPWTSKNLNQESLAFQECAQQFQTLCTNNKFLTLCQIPQMLTERITVALYSKITLAKVPELPLSYTTLLEKLATVIVPELPTTLNAKLTAFTSQELAIHNMIAWCQQKHLEHPTSQLGCLVNNLKESASAIARACEATEFKLLGPCSLQEPSIQSALSFLKLTNNNWEELSAFLLSPYLKAADTEYFERAELDLKLRHSNQFSLTNLSMPFVKEFLSYKQALSATLLPFAAWIPHFKNLLQRLGWPGPLPFSPKEQQGIIKFYEVLEELASMQLTQHITYNQAIELLANIIKSITWLPEVTPTSIQILDLHQGPIVCDYLWIMGVEQNNWPQPKQLNPWIPANLQPRDASSYQHNYHAREIIFSYVSDNTPSSLVQHLPTVTFEFPLAPTKAQQILAQRRLEPFSDNFAPKATTISGYKALELQAQCPFRAYATLRLMATELPIPSPGLNKLQRGILIHKVLELFWKALPSQEALLKLPQETLDNLVANCIHQACQEVKYPQALLQVEKRCLARLISKFLLLEKARDFFTVIATEKTLETNLYDLRIRLDRIDQLANHSTLLIDYKTGEKPLSFSDLCGKRPKNVQIPLYFITYAHAKHLAIAHINLRQLRWQFITLEELQKCFPDPITWEALRKYWQATLTELAEQFILGNATVDPVDKQTCRTCYLQPLCRIYA